MTRRILLAEIMHESNTFNKIATTKADFAGRYWLEAEDIAENLEATNTEVWGVLEAGKLRGWKITHPFAASASPSGPMAADTWREVKDKITTPLQAGKKFDAIILVLHGAMVTQSSDDADGELLALVRKLAGPETMIAATLDMHANVSELMVQSADILMAYRTYPHIDQFDRAQHLADIVDTALKTRQKPHLSFARKAMMDAADHGRTDPPGPMNRLLARAEEIEQDPSVSCVSLQIGFPWADVDHQGPSVAVTGTDRQVCDAYAEELVDALWQSRAETQLDFARPEAAMERAHEGGPGDRPFIMADFADNPAGGAHGDSPNLLRHMIEADLQNAAFATISDPITVQKIIPAGEGARVKIDIGGRGAPDLTPPLAIEGLITLLSDGDFVCEGPMWQGVHFSMGPSAVIQVGGIEVILSSVPTAVMDLQVFRSMGIEPSEKTTLALKSRNHFRAAYGPLARDVLLVDAGGIASMRLSELPYKNLKRPTWPLD
ncbi:MAG: M81 family metallopeptidase [Alphaproteobacteria bacterium]|nr:M81 family metallopeptidase [Alphaproteobacteria bacterium]